LLSISAELGGDKDIGLRSYQGFLEFGRQQSFLIPSFLSALIAMAVATCSLTEFLGFCKNCIFMVNLGLLPTLSGN
jgi:hypothetical protein